MDSLYKIRPLKWTKNFQDWQQEYSAEVPFGSFTVSRYRESCNLDHPWGEWRWEYCFSENYDEGGNLCKNARDGKLEAEKYWLKRLLPALKPVA